MWFPKKEKWIHACRSSLSLWRVLMKNQIHEDRWMTPSQSSHYLSGYSAFASISKSVLYTTVLTTVALPNPSCPFLTWPFPIPPHAGRCYTDAGSCTWCPLELLLHFYLLQKTLLSALSLLSLMYHICPHWLGLVPPLRCIVLEEGYFVWFKRFSLPALGKKSAKFLVLINWVLK